MKQHQSHHACLDHSDDEGSRTHKFRAAFLLVIEMNLPLESCSVRHAECPWKGVCEGDDVDEKQTQERRALSLLSEKLFTSKERRKDSTDSRKHREKADSLDSRQSLWYPATPSFSALLFKRQQQVKQQNKPSLQLYLLQTLLYVIDNIGSLDVKPMQEKTMSGSKDQRKGSLTSCKENHKLEQNSCKNIGKNCLLKAAGKQHTEEASTRCCVPSGCNEESKVIRMDNLGEAVAVICNNPDCDARFMHKDCFEDWESSVLSYLRTLGRARSWSEKQRLQNLWTKKGWVMIDRYIFVAFYYCISLFVVNGSVSLFLGLRLFVYDFAVVLACFYYSELLSHVVGYLVWFTGSCNTMKSLSLYDFSSPFPVCLEWFYYLLLPLLPHCIHAVNWQVRLLKRIVLRKICNESARQETLDLGNCLGNCILLWRIGSSFCFALESGEIMMFLSFISHISHTHSHPIYMSSCLSQPFRQHAEYDFSTWTYRSVILSPVLLIAQRCMVVSLPESLLLQTIHLPK